VVPPPPFSTIGRSILRRDPENGISIIVQHSAQNITCLVLSALLRNATPSDVLPYIMDWQQRKKWDIVSEEMGLVEKLDDNNDIVHLMSRKVLGSPAEPSDFCLLRSCRHLKTKSDEEIVVSNRSVTHDKCPPKPGYQRHETLSSGFILRSKTEKHKPLSEVAYVIQLSSKALHLLIGDITGDNSMLFRSFLNLQRLNDSPSAS